MLEFVFGGGMKWKSLQNGSDIRGVAMEGVPGEPVTLSSGVMRSLGRCLVDLLEQRSGDVLPDIRIAIGRDSRVSGEALSTAFAEGVVGAGATVLDCGMASTPAMFMATKFPEIGADGAVMLTASHLPWNRNGLKFFTSAGGFDKADIRALLDRAATLGELSAPTQPASGERVDLMSRYTALLVEIIRDGARCGDRPLQGLRIIVDAGNGAGGFFVDKVLLPLGADTTGSQFLEPDGRFPNHVPNPEDPAAMAAITGAVLHNGADLGIVFDTDVDRAAAVDRHGRPINRNRFIALMAALVLEQHPGATIVTDSVTSTGLRTWIQRLGGEHHRYRRGYKNVINEAIRLNEAGVDAPLAMETSGHGALRENHFLDDGAYQVARILIKVAALHSRGEPPIDALIADLPEPVEASEHRPRILAPDFGAYGDEVLAQLAAFALEQPGWSLTPDNYEGVHISCQDGWALLRKSLHDPVLPLNIESDRLGGVAEIEAVLASFLARFDALELPSALAVVEPFYPIGIPGQPWTDADKTAWYESREIQRSYRDEVLEKVERLGAAFDVRQYGALSIDPDRYPLFAVESASALGAPWALVTGGVHGYETSGVQGALAFLESVASEYAGRLNLVVIPCVSPWGYEVINRWNPQAIDPNRSFVADSPAEESRALMKWLDALDVAFLVHIDLHETTDSDEDEFRPALAAREGRPHEPGLIPDGFYTVGDTENPQAAFQGAIIAGVEALTHIAPADGDGKIIGSEVTQNGVINYPFKALGLCAGVTSARFTTTTEVYPDSPNVTPHDCNAAQVAAVRAALDYALLRNG